MITDAILGAFLSCLTALTSLIPTFTMPGSASGASPSEVGHYADEINTVFPLTTLIQCIAVSFTLMIALQVLDLAVWIYHQLHGSD